MADRERNPERRRHYRSSGRVLWGISLVAHTPRGAQWPAEIVDASAGGARILVRATGLPPIRAGETVGLALQGPGGGGALALRALALRCVPRPGGFLYGLRFLTPVALEVDAPVALREAFNRRRLPRVHPVGVDALRAVVTPADRSGGGVVLDVADISAGGLAFVVPLAAHRALGTGYLYRVELALPGTGAALALYVQVRYRVRLREGWRYGLELDKRRTADLASARALISAYIERLLKRRRSRRES